MVRGGADRLECGGGEFVLVTKTPLVGLCVSAGSGCECGQPFQFRNEEGQSCLAAGVSRKMAG